MEWVKTTAKTLPEAIDLALDNLGVDEAEAEIVVLEEPRQGLFGRMRGTARVEARVKPKPIRPKNERGRNRKGRNEGRGGKGGRNNDRNRNRNNKKQGGDDTRSGGNRSGGNRSKGGGRNEGQRDQGGNQDKQTADGGSNRSRRSQKGKGAPRERNQDEGGSGRQTEATKSRNGSGRSGRGGERAKENRREEQPVEESSVEEVTTHLEQFLVGLTEAFGFEDGVTIDDSEDEVLVGRIEGQHGLMVGPKGRTLDAVQELARITCQRSAPSSIRIKVDVGGYRQQRAEALASFARKAADKAVADQVEVALDPMSAGDRKSVHDALNEDDRVETRSIGNDPRRRVLVVPLATDDVADDDDDDEVPAEDGAEDAADDTVEDAAEVETEDAAETNGSVPDADEAVAAD